MGFYHDFDIDHLNDKDLQGIKIKMDQVISTSLLLVREEALREENRGRILGQILDV